MPTGDAPGFPSLAAMRAGGRRLEGGPQSREIYALLAAGVATGTVLDAQADREAAQGLLNDWAAALRERLRASGEPLPNHRLADFNPATADRVAAAAEAAVAGMGDADREAARRVLLTAARLAPAGRADLDRAAAPDAVARVLDALITAGAVRRLPGADDADDEIDLTFAALARHWGRLRDWVKERERFRDAARLWDDGRQAGRPVPADPGWLATAPWPADRTSVEAMFVAELEAELTRQRAGGLGRLRRLLFVAVGVSAALIAVGVFALVRAERARADAEVVKRFYLPARPAANLTAGRAVERPATTPDQTDRFDLTVPPAAAGGPPFRLTVSGTLAVDVLVLGGDGRVVARYAVAAGPAGHTGDPLPPGAYVVVVKPVWLDATQTYTIELSAGP